MLWLEVIRNIGGNVDDVVMNGKLLLIIETEEQVIVHLAVQAIKKK